MPTFIDESGDVGPDEGCARYFRLAAVWFESRDSLIQYVEAIESLKAKLNLSQTFEFHFTRLNHHRRLAFFQAVQEIPFGFASCTILKDGYSRSILTKEWIRQTAVDGLISLLEKTYRVAENRKPAGNALNEGVRFDQCDDPSYEKLLKERFRSLASGRGANNKLIGDVKPAKSKVDSCIQLADMICGAIGRHIEGETVYHDLVKHKRIGTLLYDGQKKDDWSELTSHP